MNKNLTYIQSKFPELFNTLNMALPLEFFSNPNNAPILIKRKYNDILSEYFIKTGDFIYYSSLQFILI